MPPTHLDEGNAVAGRERREPLNATESLRVSGFEGASLLRALASSNEEEAKLALEQWKRLLQGSLLRGVRRLIDDDADAEEIVADAFLALWDDRRRFASAADEGFNNPWGWLWEVVRRLVADRFRHKRARKRGGQLQRVTLTEAERDQAGPEAGYMRAIDFGRFRNRLTPLDRVIWDRHRDGQSVKEISSALRGTSHPLTRKQVRSRLDAVRARFMDLFGLGSS